MKATLLAEPEDLITVPHLSHSRIGKWLTCPEQYRLYYVEGLRPKVPSANLAFGSAIHQSLARLFADRADTVAVFSELWSETRDTELQYGYRDTWESLHEKGRRLLAKFVAEELPLLGSVAGVEKPFELSVTNLDVPLVGIIDLLVERSAVPTVVDFKTASASYEEHEAILSDQLTGYLLAEPTAQQAAFCVLVKTKEPRIEWHVVPRSSRNFIEYLRTVEIVGSDIAAGRFLKRPGKHCSWCDYQGLCTGMVADADETFIRTL